MKNININGENLSYLDSEKGDTTSLYPYALGRKDNNCSPRVFQRV